jgi:hypothetical protein
MASITTHCPPWEYKDVQGYDGILAQRAMSALIQLRSLSPAQRLTIIKDTRPVHKPYFLGLTPTGFDYYAGHYRGENFICLKDARVQIRDDPSVGHPPDRIADDMAVLANDLMQTIGEGDIVWAANNLVLAHAEKLYRVTQLGVAVFVYFLQIHPFINGNGHMARFLLIAFLSWYGVFLSKWPLHPRPQDPPYSELIKRYRLGDRRSLEHFVLSCI